MKYNIADKFTLTPHAFGSHIPAQAKYLVVGTFPAHKRNFEFFYSGDENRFWLIMGKVFGYSFKESIGPKAKQERKDFLTDNDIGMTDMHKVCYRRNSLSGDEHLYSVILNDVLDILGANITIHTMVFTSRADAIGALGLFKILLIQKGMEVPALILKTNKVLYGTLTLNERRIDIYVPYSPSSRLSEIATSKLVEMYSYIFSD
jgi:G:T/U-mismatch repair DNA glycosylase